MPGQPLAQLTQELVGDPLLSAGLGFDQEWRRVDTEARDAEPQPEQRDLAYLLPHGRVVGVEIRLEAIEAVPVPRAGCPVVAPSLFLDTGEQHPRKAVRRLRLRPDVPVMERRLRIRAGGLKPRMRVA